MVNQIMGCDPKFSACGKIKASRNKITFHLSVSGSVCLGAGREEDPDQRGEDING